MVSSIVDYSQYTIAMAFRFDDVKSTRAFPMSGPCSHITRIHQVGSLVFTRMIARTSGQQVQEEQDKVPPSQAATALLLQDLRGILEKVGATPNDVVSTSFFQRDIMDMPVVGKARADVFVGRHPPSGSIPAKNTPLLNQTILLHS